MLILQVTSSALLRQLLLILICCQVHLRNKSLCKNISQNRYDAAIREILISAANAVIPIFANKAHQFPSFSVNAMSLLPSQNYFSIPVLAL